MSVILYLKGLKFMLIENNNVAGQVICCAKNHQNLNNKKTLSLKYLEKDTISFSGPINQNGVKFFCNVALRTLRTEASKQITLTQSQRKTICDFMQNCSYGYADFIRKQLPFSIQSLSYKEDKKTTKSYTQCNINYQASSEEHIGACQNLAKQLYDYLNTQEIFTSEFDINLTKGLYLTQHDKMSHFFVTLCPIKSKSIMSKPQILLDPSFNTIAHYNPITFPKYMFAKPFETSQMQNMQNTFSLENNLRQPFGFAKDLLKKCPDNLHNNLVYFDFNNGKTNFYINSNALNPFMTTIPRDSLQIDLSYLENIENIIQHHIQRGEYEAPHLFDN